VGEERLSITQTPLADLLVDNRKQLAAGVKLGRP
jgi:hypothetical protein